jgi:hypothetical protein
MSARSRIVWTCSVCKEPIGDEKGYVVADVLAALDVLDDEQKWHEDHQAPAGELQVVTYKELSTYPPHVSWQILHSKCDPRPAYDGDYAIDVARARSAWDLLWWTAHLMGKNWVPATNWDDVLRHVAMQSGSGDP